jgi:hypothetical protein
MDTPRYTVEEQKDGRYTVLDTHLGTPVSINIGLYADALKEAADLNWENVPGRKDDRRGQPPL